MERYVTKTFIGFFFGFLAIIAIAFAIILITAQQEPKPVDNIALPQ